MPATPEYVDIILWDGMDEPSEVSVEVDGKPTPLTAIKREDVGDGFETTYRVQLR